MGTKTCEKCGWVVDDRTLNNYCPVCKTKFKIGICTTCGRLVTFYRPRQNVCKECYDKYTRKPDATSKYRKKRAARYTTWVEKISHIPKDYPTLTEAQWLAAVKHFNGCAICGAETIDTRQYFIPFKDGGRYCDWNIIPVCTNCAITTARAQKAGLIYFTRFPIPVGLKRTTEYLEERINEALKYGSESSE